MTATITDQFKRELTEDLKSHYDSGARYYIAIGRAEQWGDVDTPPDISQLDYLQSPSWSRQTRLALQSAKRVFNLSYVIPRYNWTTGTIYQSYDDTITDVTDNSKYYVLNDQNQVYMCLRTGKTGGGANATSTVQPTGTSLVPFKTADGYFWKFMYTISVGDTDKYVTTKFMPVQFVDSAGPNDPATLQQQFNVQNASLPKQIVGYKVVSGGTGYTSNPTLEVIGNGSGATAVASISSGQVVSVQVDSNGSGTGWNFGSNYDYANVIVTGGGGSGARIRPILSQPLGLGGDPVQDLRATRLMFNVQLIDDEEDTIIADGQDFRQMTLLKNPTKYQSDSDYTEITGNFLNYLKLSSVSGGEYSKDDIVTGPIVGNSTPTAIVDRYYDSAGVGFLYYHQNDSTGYQPFAKSTVVSNGPVSGTIDSDVSPDLDRFNGQLLYVDNRVAIPRDAESRQDLKIVIRF